MVDFTEPYFDAIQGPGQEGLKVASVEDAKKLQ